MRLQIRIFRWITAALFAVYWGLALPFSLLLLNLSVTQLHWTFLIYLWETPVLGGLGVILPLWLWLRPIVRHLTSTDEVEVRQTRRRAERLPFRIAVPVMSTSLLVYALGAVQLRELAMVPYEEVVKNSLLALPTGLMLSLLCYFIVSLHLRRVIERCERLFPAESDRPPVLGLRWKIWACLVVAGLAPLAFMGLTSYTFGQRQLESSLLHSTERRLTALALDMNVRGSDVVPLEARAGDTLALTDFKGRLTRYQGTPPDKARLLVDLSNLAEGTRGSTILRDDLCRVVSWQQVKPKLWLVASVPLAAHDYQLKATLNSLLVTTAVVLIIVGVLAFLLAQSLSSPLTVLTDVATRVPATWPHQLREWHSDDEIGVLGRAFRRMLGSLEQSQQNLEKANRRLAESNANLTILVDAGKVKVKQMDRLALISGKVSRNLEQNAVLEQLMTQLQGIVRCDACSVLLQEHNGLELKSSWGLESPHKLLHNGCASCALYADCQSRAGCCARWRGGQCNGHDAPPRQVCFDESQFPVAVANAGFRSILSLPLVTSGRHLGILNVFGQTQERLPADSIELLTRLAHTGAVALENARLYEEKNHVTELLQGALIPQMSLSFDGVDAGHRFRASKLLSGDFYDVIRVAPDRLGIMMADVAGKGPDAAIQTVRAKYLIRASALAGFPPAGVLELLNRQLEEDSGARNLTAFYAEINQTNHTAVFCNAGHEPPLLWQPSLGRWQGLPTTAIMLGALSPLNAEEGTIYLEAGSYLLLFTDGVSEARAPSGEFLGTEPVMQVASQYVGRPAQEMVDAIYSEIERFAEGEFSDDVSLLAVRFLG